MRDVVLAVFAQVAAIRVDDGGGCLLYTSDRDGASTEEVRRQAGMRGELAEVQLPPGYYAAFVELHIEQGFILERCLLYTSRFAGKR